MRTDKMFHPICDNDTKELRKCLNLPIQKDLRYMHKCHGEWHEERVTGYEIVAVYMPSETSSLLVTTESGEKVRILAPYFAQMQSPSFVQDMEDYEVV